MTGKVKTSVDLKIPDNTTLPEIIELLNLIGLKFTPARLNNEISQWVYDHKEWVIDGE